MFSLSQNSQAGQMFYILHAACWWPGPQSPVMQSKLCGCKECLRHSSVGLAPKNEKMPYACRASSTRMGIGHCLSFFGIGVLFALRHVKFVMTMPIRFIALIVKERIHVRLDVPEVLQFFAQPGQLLPSLSLLAEQEIVFL